MRMAPGSPAGDTIPFGTALTLSLVVVAAAIGQIRGCFLPGKLRPGMVGMGGAIFDTYGRMPNRQPITFAITLGPRSEQNTYVAELEAMAVGIQAVPPYLLRREITIVTSNQASLQVVSRPKQQSGQVIVMRIYDAVRELREGYNRVLLMWAPAQQEFHLGKEAKKAARKTTEAGRLPQKQFCNAKSTIINVAKSKKHIYKTLPHGVGAHLKKIDTALPFNTASHS
jgi:hypothetical protein